MNSQDEIDSNPAVDDANAEPGLSSRAAPGPAKGMSNPDLKHIKGIYFDLDDTLCSYWEASKFALFRAFELHGPDGYTPQEMVKHWASAFRSFGPSLKQTGWYPIYLKTGEPTRTEQMRLALLEIGIVDQDRAIKLSAAYAQERDRALRLFDETLKVLEKLHGTYPLGLVTNGPADVQRQEVETLDLTRFFDHIYIEGEMGEGKPNPTVFTRAAEAMGLAPAELLFVGNSYVHDVRPALDAGWHAVWVRRPTDVPPSASGPETAPHGSPTPDAIISDLTDLFAMLGI